MRREGETELGARLVQPERAGVRRVRRDAEANPLRERVRDLLSDALEPLRRGRLVRAEDLEVHDRPETQVGAGGGSRSAEAAVTDRRDPGAKALECAKPGACRHLLEADPPLSLHVQRDPRPEWKPVAEPRVDGVLEVGVRVDEAGKDHGLGKALALAELRRRADRSDAAVLSDRHCAVLDRRAFDRDDPVGRENPHEPSSRASSSSHGSSAGHLRSISTESQIDASNRRMSGTISIASDTGSTVGRSAAKMSRITYAYLRFWRKRVEVRMRRRTSASTKIGMRKRQPSTEQGHGDERHVVARPDLVVVELVVEVGQEVERSRQHDVVHEEDPHGEERGRKDDEHESDALEVRRDGRSEERPDLPEEHREHQAKRGDDADLHRSGERLRHPEGDKPLVIGKRIDEPLEDLPVEGEGEREGRDDREQAEDQPAAKLVEVLDEGGLLTMVEAAREPPSQGGLLGDAFPLGLFGGDAVRIRGRVGL